jgi:hypothetical protein
VEEEVDMVRWGLDVAKKEKEVEDAVVVVWTTLYRQKDKNNWV